MTFFCQADGIFEKTVEQSRFEQMHFKQLTLTQFFVSKIITNFAKAALLVEELA
jgi:hypothetical protein